MCIHESKGLLCTCCRTRSYKEAVEWYETAVEIEHEDESGEFDATMDNPKYLLKSKIADLYLEGGYGLEKDPSYAGESGWGLGLGSKQQLRAAEQEWSFELC